MTVILTPGEMQCILLIYLSKFKSFKKMAGLRELFHGIPNHLNAISIVSATMAEMLERQNAENCDLSDIGVLRSKIDSALKIMGQACRSTREDIKALAGIIRDELELNNEFDDNFARINREMEKIENLFGKVKDMKADSAVSLAPLAKEFSFFEKNCFDLAVLLREIKADLVALDRYYGEQNQKGRCP